MSQSHQGRWVVGGFLVAAVAVGALTFYRPAPIDVGRTVVVPADLDPAGQAGQATFNRVCAECHGENAEGGKGGPSLVHTVYSPNHHADGAIRLAVQKGVRAHHWGFGDMPAQHDKVTAAEVEDIIVFIRALQSANIARR